MDETGPAHSWLPKFMQRSKRRQEPTENGKPDETSNLLPKINGHIEESEQPENGEIYDLSDDPKSRWRVILHEFTILLKASIPVILAYTLQNSLQTFSVVIVGRGSPEDLATAAFSYMFAMCTAWLIALGGTTALDTLCSSAFTGSHDPHELGVLLQRAFIALGGFYVPVVILWFFAEPLFKALGQGDQLSHDSARFLWCLIPGGLGYIYFECMKKFLQAQGLSSTYSAGCHCLQGIRNHAARNVRTANYLANQRWSQLFACLYLQDGTPWSTDSNRDLLLAVVLATTRLRTLRQGLGGLGRVVSQMLTSHGNIRSICDPRYYPRGDRMVGL